MWLVMIYQLMWSMWSAECTRCGGNDHTLSKCRWPAAYRERIDG